MKNLMEEFDFSNEILEKTFSLFLRIWNVLLADEVLANQVIVKEHGFSASPLT